MCCGICCYILCQIEQLGLRLSARLTDPSCAISVLLSVRVSRGIGGGFDELRVRTRWILRVTFGAPIPGLCK